MDLLPQTKALLDTVPAPLLCLAARDAVPWANAAARTLAPQASPADWAAWMGEVWPSTAPAPADTDLPLPGGAPLARRVRLQTSLLPEGGWILGLVPVDELRAAQDEVTHLQEMLDLARDFGRLGLWERDARTLAGTWDRQVQSFRGITTDGKAPSFDDSLQQVALADRAALDRAFRESLRQPGAYSHRFSLRTADGTLRRVHSQWRVKADASGRPSRAIGLLVDDVEPLALATASSEVESQLALAVDLGRIALWRHDLQTQRMSYNAQAWAVLDLPPRPEGLAIEDVRALVHPEDLPALLASARLALESDRPVDVETRYRRLDGSWRHVLTRRVVQRDASGTAIAFVGVSMDVTERRESEQALRNAGERAALVTRSAGLGTWEIDLRNETAYWDDQMWLLRGLPPQPRAMTPAERMAVVHPDDRERVLAQQQLAMTQSQAAENEFRVVWPDGQVRWIASRSQTLRDEQGQPTRRIGVNWDVTAARTAAAMRQERELAQRESTAKSQFMARMSHELRTPLNAVLGFTELLLADEPATDPDTDPAGPIRRRRLQHVRVAGQHLLTLINDVLDLAALDSGELRIVVEPMSLPGLLQQTLPMLQPLLDASQVLLNNEVAGQPPLRVLADAMRLRQVLLNLLSNAVKYNRAGGRVDVQAWQSGADVHVRVTDTGRGLSAEQMRHLFEPFNRVGAESSGIEGSGLGLTIAKTLTERMGGLLQVHSQVGQGSSFELRLRAAQAAQEDVAEGPAAIEAPAPHTVPGRQPHPVLYIEDNPVNALIVSELLARRQDIQLHLAVDGRSGLARARELQPELLLLDMQLPDINGLEVLGRLRADPATAGIRCMALSANAMPEDIERALRAGAVQYWTKPLDFRAFMAALDALFGPAPP